MRGRRRRRRRRREFRGKNEMMVRLGLENPVV
jgi:hypothetical protein